VAAATRPARPSPVRTATPGLPAEAWRRARHPDEPPSRVRPAWVAAAERAIAATPYAGHARGAPPDAFADAFADALGGFVALGIDALGPAHPVAAHALARQLRRVVADAARRTLVLELHVARLRGRLHGDTPADRFATFVALLGERDVRAALFEEYPVLARFLVESVLRRASACAELLGRLTDDEAMIAPALAPALAPGRTLGALVELRLGVGDVHDGGRAVACLRFESGVEIVYKPRSLAVEAHYAALADWLNDRRVAPPLRTARVLDRGAYGWMERVAAAPCASRAQLHRFYARHGAHLALLHALDATDMHLENVVAAGEHPVLVDLEAVLHPRLGDPTTDAAHDAFAHSVLRVGLLPNGAPAGDARGVYDRSGIGGGPGQVVPSAVPRFVDVATDAMRLESRYVEAPVADNRPSLRGAPVDPSAYVDDVAAGFDAAYRALVADRAALLAPGGPLHAFRGDETRVVVRDTRFYAALLGRSLHPNVLRDAAARARVLDHVGASARRTELVPLATVEARALRDGDVPRFTAHADATDLRHGGQHASVRHLPMPGYAALVERMATLGTDDLARQTALVRGAMATLRVGAAGSGRPGSLLPRVAAPAAQARLLALADDVAARLATLALRRDGRVAWIGIVHTAGGHWRLDRLGPALYDGSAGIALFLAYHGAVTGSERSTSLARDAVAALLRDRESGSIGVSLGGFAGDGGLIHLLAHAGRLWRDAALIDRAASLAIGCAPRIETDHTLDVVGGCAGLLKAVLALHRVAPSAALRDVAERCGARLVATARPALGGTGWGNPDGPPLLGYAHGASGIAAALAALWTLTRHRAHRDAAESALAYERAAFRPDLGDWPDLRTGSGAMTAWCHGAPGIALARAELRAALGPDPLVEAELRHALRRTARRGLRGSHSLCHGGLGALDAVHAGIDALGGRGSPRLEPLVARTASSIARYGPVCGTPHAVETPGLMTGLAGIGYGLLRLAAPGRVPSVLTLSPPLA